MAERKGGRQATLGYVRDPQLTIGWVGCALQLPKDRRANTFCLALRKFFGTSTSSTSSKDIPKRQSTLAFSDRNKEKGENEGTIGKESNAASPHGTPQGIAENRTHAFTAALKADAHSSDSDDANYVSRNLKRGTSEDGEESGLSDIQPVSKRRRRGPQQEDSPVPKTSTKPARGTASDKGVKPKASPRKAGRNASGGGIPTGKNKLPNMDTKQEEIQSTKKDEEDEEDEKPELKTKKIEKVQVTSKGSDNDPYPDWKPNNPVPYAALCTTLSLIEMTTKRLIILSHCSLFLRQVLRLTPNDLLPTVQLMINKLAADYSGIELGIGESLIMKAVGESTGRSLAVIKADQHEIGDLGLVAAKSRSNQPTMFKPKPLTVRGVHEGLLAIAKVQGHGSQDKKISGIKKLLSAADVTTSGKGSKGTDITKDKGGPSEAKFIVRFLEGKLRLGLAEKTVLVALAQAMVAHEAMLKGKKVPSAEELAEGEVILKTVFSELPSYEVIIPAILEHGLFKLREVCKLQPGVPLKPMLAKPTKSITEVLDRFEGKDFTCEYKYDGERAQIHYVAPESVAKYPSSTTSLQKDGKGLCAIFSRNSEDLSKKYPDILAKIETWIKPGVQSFVLDCETVAWDVDNKKVLPFQQLMTRKRKDVKAEDVKVKVCVFAFDLLFLDGEVSCREMGVDELVLYIDSQR